MYNLQVKQFSSLVTSNNFLMGAQVQKILWSKYLIKHKSINTLRHNTFLKSNEIIFLKVWQMFKLILSWSEMLKTLSMHIKSTHLFLFCLFRSIFNFDYLDIISNNLSLMSHFQWVNSSHEVAKVLEFQL